MKKRHKATKQKTAKAKPPKRAPAKPKRRAALPPATAKRHKPSPLAHSPVAILAADWHQDVAPVREQLQATLPLGKIKIGERHRKDFGNLAALAADINARGLLQPVVVDRDNKLIAGERRLRAWQLSIFRTEPIPVRFVPLKDIVAGEWAENDPSLRKDFTPSEGVAIKQAIEAALKPVAAARQAHGLTGRGRVLSPADLREPVHSGEQAAAFTGRSRRTLEKAEEIVKAAEAEPDKYGALKDAMDKSGRVDGPHKRLKNMQAAAQIRAEPAPLPDNGPYRGVVIDFPWAAEPEDDDPERLARGYYPYPTMSISECAEFARVHIKSRLHADAWVALWITNFHLAKGHQVPIALALGANAVTILTGRKDAVGRGQVARGTTEHVVLLRIGKPPIETFPRTDFDFEVDRKNHSRKPQSFYAAFERAVAAPRYASFFETTPRGDKWDCHGNKMTAAAAAGTDDAVRPPASAAVSAGKGGRRSRGAAALPAAAVSAPSPELALADAQARQRGENLDGSPRREARQADLEDYLQPPQPAVDDGDIPDFLRRKAPEAAQ